MDLLRTNVSLEGTILWPKPITELFQANTADDKPRKSARVHDFRRVKARKWGSKIARMKHSQSRLDER